MSSRTNGTQGRLQCATTVSFGAMPADAKATSASKGCSALRPCLGRHTPDEADHMLEIKCFGAHSKPGFSSSQSPVRGKDFHARHLPSEAGCRQTRRAQRERVPAKGCKWACSGRRGRLHWRKGTQVTTGWRAWGKELETQNVFGQLLVGSRCACG